MSNTDELLKMKQNLMTQNVQDGLLAQEAGREDLTKLGFTIISNNGIGSDDYALDPQGILNLVEYKLGEATLSPTQLKTKRIVEKAGIPYLEYRISRVHLEYYKEQKLKETLSKNQITKSIFNASQFPGRWEIKMPHTCPNCDSIAHNIVSIFLKFGLRNMGNGIVREQSYCIECRKFLRRGK